MAYELVIFDLDGTLINPKKGVLKSIDYTIKTLKLKPLSEEVKEIFIGPPIYESLKRTYNLNESEAKSATEIFRSVYKDKFLFEAEIYAGIKELLMELKAKKLKLAVATYKRQDYAELILKHFELDIYFDFIKGADDAGQFSKRDIIELCLRHFEMNFNKAAMIGDTEHDQKGAIGLGIDFIAVSWGFGFKTENELEKFPYRAYFRDAKGLKKYLLEKIEHA